MNVSLEGRQGWKWQAGGLEGQKTFRDVAQEHKKVVSGVRGEDTDDEGEMEADDWL